MVAVLIRFPLSRCANFRRAPEHRTAANTALNAKDKDAYRRLRYPSPPPGTAGLVAHLGQGPHPATPAGIQPVQALDHRGGDALGAGRTRGAVAEG